MTDAIASLVGQLEVEQLDRDGRWSSWLANPGDHARNMAGRLFGGIVMAQSLVAAGRTLPDRRVHSLQQVFLRAGDPDASIVLHCEVLFEGRTYASLRVEVSQDDDIISHAQVGLTGGVPGGPEFESSQTPRSSFDATANRDEYRARPNWQGQPVEIRGNEAHELDDVAAFDTWLRPTGPIGSDPLLHQAVLTFSTDRAFMGTAWKPVRAAAGPPAGTSLDHTIWFHRPVRFDDWHLFTMRSDALIDGRGLNHGQVQRCDDGSLVATVSQQSSLRTRQR